MTLPSTVLFCSQSASAIGGVESWLHELCANLDRRRWRPLVALVRGSRAHDPDRFRAAHPDMETVEIDGRGLNQESRVRAVARCVRRVAPSFFVPLVVADAHEAAARLRAQDSRCRYLLTLHGNTEPQLLDARNRLPFVDFAIAPGLLTCRLLREMGMPEGRLRHVANGAREASMPRVARAAGAPLRLGYVGRLTQRDKRVGDLVPLVKSLVTDGLDFHLTIAGDGPERAELSSALSGYPVEFLGAVDAERLYRDIYPRLDVVLLFSESEAFGITLVEAMAHGVVPVCSSFIGQPSEGIVIHERTGLVFPVGDIGSAACQLRRLEGDPGLFVRLSQAAQAQVAGKYTWTRCVQGWDDALQAAMAMPPREVPPYTPVRSPVAASRLDRLGVPSGIVDGLRRARRSLFGVPQAMEGGEEWPWIPPRQDPGELAAMSALRRSLDIPEGAPHA